MKLIVLLSVSVLFAGCAVPQGGMKRGLGGFSGAASQPAQQPSQQYFVDETVDIITDPPGAKIFVNDAFMGYAPVKADVRRAWRGDPRSTMTLDLVRIEARPAEAGQCAQSGVFGQGSAKAPPQVRFNMTSCSAAAPAPAARKRGK